MVNLRAGEVEAELTPEAGGGLTALRFRGADILRPAPVHLAGPEELSCFPLVPFANRINRGRFTWQGRDIRLAPHLGDSRHPLHGHGWLRPWRVARIDPSEAALELRFEPEDWPWRYTARQTVALDGDGINLGLELANTGETAMPAGLGFHPFFPDRAGARLTTHVERVWLTDAEDIPARTAPPDQFGDWSAGAHLPTETLIDHCHAGWMGQALVEWPAKGLAVRLTGSDNLRWLHIYAPPHQDFFCLEPMSHRPDALNAPSPADEGMVTLGPGETLRAEVRLTILPSAQRSRGLT